MHAFNCFFCREGHPPKILATQDFASFELDYHHLTQEQARCEADISKLVEPSGWQLCDVLDSSCGSSAAHFDGTAKCMRAALILMDELSNWMRPASIF